MGKQQFKTLEFPLLSILSHKEYIIVSGGVGTENTSQNKIVVYHKNTVLDEPLFVLKTGKDLIQNLSSNGKTDLISCTAGRFCIIYRVDNEKHTITEVSRFATDTDAQNANIFNSKGDVLITGGDDKNIKVWDVAEQENKVVVKKNKDISYHTDKILHLDISVDDTLVCSASKDNTCGIFEIQTGNLLKRISFSEDALDANLRFSYCFFARDEKYMYTIQNPRNDESSYLTQWKIEDNYEPEKTIFLNKKPVTAACINDEGLFMGIGTEDGSTKIINTRHFEVDCGIQVHNTAVESVNFINDSRALASVCRDNSFYFLANVRPEGAFSKISKKWVAAMFIIYFLMFLYEKVSPLWKGM